MLCGAAPLAHGQAFINDFSPKAGMPGDIIQVYGSGFSVGTIRVYFWNGVPATTRVTTDTMLTATVPAGATTGVLGVQRDAGQPIYTSASFTVIGAGPYITDVSPAYGDTNTLVVISGVHLGSVPLNGVQFNGVASKDAYPSSADGTQVTVHVPYGAPPGTAPLVVTTPYGSSNSPSSFTVVGPGPFVAGFAPDHGTANLSVSIFGTHLAATTNVTFNGVPGVGFHASETLITVLTPAGVTTGPITVNSPFGSFTTSDNFFVPPTITGVSPPNGRTGTNVTLTGTNFRGATSVNFNGNAAAFTIVNNTNIQAIVPASATSGLIQVLTPDFSCVSSNRFIVPPTIYGFSPVFGRPGTSVLIIGANFDVGTPIVRFNGVQSTAVSGIMFGQLTATVPAGATTTGPISISTADGSHTNANLFYLPANITGFTPNAGGPGTPLTISGLNFLDTSSVSFNGVPAFFTVSSNSSIAVLVPNNANSGPITVTTPAGSATSSSPFYASPQIVSFTPTNGLPGTNVTVTGNNFLGATAVRFNGQTASFSYFDNAKIVAVTPPGAQTGPITIEAPGGTNTSLTSYLVDYKTDLEIWITASPNPVTATSNLVYSITTVNHGPFDAPHMRVTNTLPSSVTLASASMPPPWTVTTNAGQVVATADNIAVGGQSTLTVTVVPQVPGTIVAGATVTSDLNDPNPANNSAAITTTVAPLPLLSILWWTNQVKVSWHVGLSNFVLESTAGSLSNPLWAAVTNTPAIVGTQKSVIESNIAPLKFYRLKK